MRTLIASLLIALALVPARAQQGPLAATQHAMPERAPEITMAVRIDTRPFIWKDQFTGQYLGFFWDVCTEAVQRAGYRFRVVEVDAEARKAFLSKASEPYDLLCDPTTITLGRMKNFADAGGAFDLAFSPIVFVANGTYERSAELPQAWGRLPDDAPDAVTCEGLFAWLDRESWLAGTGEEPPGWNQSENKERGHLRSPEGAEGASDAWFSRLKRNLTFTLRAPDKPIPGDPPRRYQVWGYVTGTTTGAEVEGNLKRPAGRDGEVICTREFKSHERAAADFCDGRLDRYYGDSEIIRFAIEERREHGATCAVDTSPPAGTYEPYAFVVSSGSDRELPERFALALYGMFEDGTMERLFAGHFPEKEKSQFLSTLFRINSIPPGTDASDSTRSVADIVTGG